MFEFWKERKVRKAYLRIYENLMQAITKWNLKTFPDATQEGQKMKLWEEMDEFEAEDTLSGKMKELADVFIVLAGLRRWNDKEARQIEKDILKHANNISLSDLLDAMFQKMMVNMSRNWVKQGDGRFHHTETPKKKKKPTKKK